MKGTIEDTLTPQRMSESLTRNQKDHAIFSPFQFQLIDTFLPAWAHSRKYRLIKFW